MADAMMCNSLSAPRHRRLAQNLLAERREWPRDDLNWNWRTRTAWTYLQMAMGRASRDWTKYDTTKGVTQ